ncbi:MAG: helix-turn-helix transcriptional regulator [Bdellovibrionia bacterium]
MIGRSNRSKLVGDFIRNHREAMKMSQKNLGQCFNPPVTTQFISNIERGVTPLPVIHVTMLAKALSASDAEIMSLLEKEYALKLSGRVGKLGHASETGTVSGPPPLIVSDRDYNFIRSLYDAYRVADTSTQTAFAAVCENMLKLSK